MYVFLSPHFDDAAGSAGGIIRRLSDAKERVCVMTFTAKIPFSKLKSAIYVIRRRIENSRACRVLGASVCNADFYDAVYRREIKSRIKQSGKDAIFNTEIFEFDLLEKITDYILKHTKPSDILIAPAGLGNHIDHKIVRKAAEKSGRKVYFYEEFYYDRNDKNPELFKNFEYEYLSYRELAVKICAMKKYKKTLEKLYGKADTMQKMSDYFTSFRVNAGQPYERFNNLEFLK